MPSSHPVAGHGNRSRARTLVLATTLMAMPSIPAAPAGYDSSAPPASPTEVRLGAYLVDLVRIDGAQQAFDADIVTLFEWQDPRLAEAGAGTRTLPLEKVWNPRVTVANLRDAKNTLPEVVEVGADGSVQYRQRLMGTFSSRLDLHAFPHDHQTLSVHFVARGFEAGEILFVADPEGPGRAENLTISDWSVGTPKLRPAAYPMPRSGRELPGTKFEFQVERRIAYYMATIVASAAIIACMAWLVFWISPEAINPRISVSVTSMLTLIAHRFVIQGELPRLSYLTRMDYFLLGATFLVLLGLAGVVAVFKVLNDGNRAGAERLNLIFRWAYPVAFLGLLATVL